MGAKIHPHRFTAHVCVAFVDTNTIFLYDGIRGGVTPIDSIVTAATALNQRSTVKPSE